MKYNKLKKGDTVKVIAGKDVSKAVNTGKIVTVDREKGRVVVEGMNMVRKTIRRRNQNEQGGIKDVEAFMDISNVMLVCPKCKEATRVGFVVKDGKKVRVCKKCKAEIN